MKTYKWFFLVLVVGMFSACNNDSEEELVGNWTIRGTFDGSDRGYAASFVLTLDGKEYGYVCCGSNGGNGLNCLRGVYKYDCSEDKWTRQADFPGTARTQAVGFACNGKGYVGTGWDKREDLMKDFWEFDPTGGPTGSDGQPIGEWREVAPLPEQEGARHSAVAFSLTVGGKEYGYVGCGYAYDEENNPLILKDLWSFDPTLGPNGPDGRPIGEWEPVKGNQGNKRYGAVAFVIDNKAYICTGYTNTSRTRARDLLMFDPNSSSSPWEDKNKMFDSDQDQDFDDDYADLERGFAASFTMPGGDDGKMKGYIALGGKSTVWEYDPLTDLWVRRTNHINNSSSISKEGATGFSFLKAINPVTNTPGRGFVCLGSSGTANYDDNREFFPTEEDNLRDDYK